SVRVTTGAGTKVCKLVKRSGREFEFEMNMGVPKIEGTLDLRLESGKVEGTKIWMGNPHFVCLVEAFSPQWREMGTRIQSQKGFPQGTNVEFVRIVNQRKIESRFFERGVGETQSSGTGSCASSVAALASGSATPPVEVVAAGGAEAGGWVGAGPEGVTH